MAHPNIDERRAQVQRLISAGIEFTAETKRTLAERFMCHRSAIEADIAYLTRPKGVGTRIATPRIKALILSRDHYTCQYCGRNDVPMVVEHVIPHNKGGVSKPYNLVAACQRCNVLKISNALVPKNIDKITKDYPEWRRRVIKQAMREQPHDR